MDKLDMLERLMKLLDGSEAAPAADPAPAYDNGMVGQYVIVRCRDAGVHAGVLESHQGRECVLTDSRRLWYWKPAKGRFCPQWRLTAWIAKARWASPCRGYT